jgi:hypothetical protein
MIKVNQLQSLDEFINEAEKMPLIKAKDCKIGETYYLTGEFWHLGKPMINTPVVFKGKDTSYVARPFGGKQGYFSFLIKDGEDVRLDANDRLFTEPYDYKKSAQNIK